MSRSTTAGTSERTPCKHQLMDKIFGREIGALSTRRLAQVPGAFWLDLTAGDGVAANGGEWIKNCSPGILARHAKWGRNVKPVEVVMYEKAPNTYRTLLDNLTEQLPILGYVRESENIWTHGHARLVVLNHDSATFDPAWIPSGWAVQVVNDPNSINTWAMNPGLMAAVKEGRWTCLGMSTMGCNVAGTKRLDREDRNGWYGHVKAQVRGLHVHHDLLLAAIERDASQWAYLITAPAVWKQEVTQDADAAFGAGGYTLRKQWLREDPVAFGLLLDHLFLTSDERAA